MGFFKEDSKVFGVFRVSRMSRLSGVFQDFSRVFPGVFRVF